MRGAPDVCGCFPTGRHYPGIADRLSRVVTEVRGLATAVASDAEWAAQKLAVIDFETTGLDPNQDRIIEIGIVCFQDGELTNLQNFLVNPGRQVSAEILELTKISLAELQAAPPLAEVLGVFANLCVDHVPVAYNATFDRGFLHAELARAEYRRDREPTSLPPAFQEEVTWIDPLVWVRELHKNERSKKLGDVCARLGIALDNAHRAASDAEATGRVLFALAERLPKTYGELIRLQGQYAARQEVEMSATFRRRT